MSLFKSIVLKLLREADETEKEPGEDSIDSQVDKYLMEYESEAKNSKNEGKDFRSLSRRFLSEAEGDEDEEEEEPEDEEGDEPKDDDDSEDSKDSKEEKKLSEEDIDVGSFAESVVRLIDNYDSLLEVRNTLLRRAANFLAKNYSKEVVDSFKEELIETHGLEIGKSKFEKEEEEQVPAADRAGSSPGGA
jgi:hypothetical protein